MVALAVASLCGAVSLAWAPVVLHKSAWVTPGDIWWEVVAARHVSNGALGYVFESTPSLRALPLWQIVLAPVVWIGDRCNLSTSFPFTLRHPSMWLVLAPYCSLTAVPLLGGARRMAHAIGRHDRLFRLQCVLAPLVVIPLFMRGHFEDVLALAFVLFAVLLAERDRPELGALLLGVAVAFKQWAALGVAVYVVAYAVQHRWPIIVGCVAALPGALAALTLSVDWPDASRALLRAPTMSLGAVPPWAGAGSMPTTTFRLGVLVASVALAVAFRHALRGPDRLVKVVAALGVVFVLRPVSEPRVFEYYLVPGICLLLIAAAPLARGRRAATSGAAFVALGALYLRLTGLWWAVTYAGIAALVALGLLILLEDRDGMRPFRASAARVGT